MESRIDNLRSESILNGTWYLDQYAAAALHGVPDITEEDSCSHLQEFLGKLRDQGRFIARPGTKEWHSQRAKCFTASTCSALLAPESPYNGSRHLSARRNDLIKKRAAHLVSVATHCPNTEAETSKVNLRAVQHGIRMEAYAVDVMKKIYEFFDCQVHGVAHVDSCSHPDLDGYFSFTPDYLFCVHRCWDNSCFLQLVEVKAPYSRPFDPMTPTPSYLYPQVAMCASGLGLNRAALLQMWGDRAVFTPIYGPEIALISFEVTQAVKMAEAEAQALAQERIRALASDIGKDAQ